MKKVSVLIMSILLMLPMYVYAAPGGKIVKAVFTTFWGRVFLIGIVILFLPLILYITIKEALAKKKAYRDLSVLAKYSPNFEWLNIESRVRECVNMVYRLWKKTDIAEASNWMTSWYWQNQKMTYLEEWESKGLENVCDLKEVSDINPFLIVHRNDNNIPHEGSQIVIGLSIKLTDYLQHKESGKIIEGDRDEKSDIQFWTFVMEDNRWLVNMIDANALGTKYLALRKSLPAIEDTIIELQNKKNV